MQKLLRFFRINLANKYSLTFQAKKAAQLSGYLLICEEFSSSYL